MDKIIISANTNMTFICDVLKEVQKIKHKRGAISIVKFDYLEDEIKYSIVHNKFGYTISSMRF